MTLEPSGLKHLSFEIAQFLPDDGSQEQFKSSLGNFLYSLLPLESLSIVNHHGYIDLPLILRHHGKHLRSLSLHQLERPQGPRPTLTLSIIELIRSDALRLEHLELDLNRTIDPEANEHQHFRVISSFPNLRSLIINYDLGVYSRHCQWLGTLGVRDSSDSELYHKVYTKPDKDFAVGIWRAVARGNRLKKMSLYFGEPDWEMDSLIAAELMYREEIYISRNERDDLKDDVAALQIVQRLRGTEGG
ncbi:hypothetical protein PM082_014356 [Marasmius tenuissimus]|nr:hypothetical protein PM082_014356 [Marasmius tenuissimus]